MPATKQQIRQIIADNVGLIAKVNSSAGVNSTALSNLLSFSIF